MEKKMELSKDERRFLARRTKLVKAWRYVGPILLAGVVGLGIWLFCFNPLLANPFIVLSRLKSDSIPQSTTILMAALLPVVFLACIFLVMAILLFAFAAFSNERKYLAIFQRTMEE